jgi:hypothetical protein
MMTVEVTKAAPAPPFKDMTITLSYEEGRRLWALLGQIGGYDDLTITKTSNTGRYKGYLGGEIRDGVQNALWGQLNVHYKEE